MQGRNARLGISLRRARGTTKLAVMRPRKSEDIWEYLLARLCVGILLFASSGKVKHRPAAVVAQPKGPHPMAPRKDEPLEREAPALRWRRRQSGCSASISIYRRWGSLTGYPPRRSDFATKGLYAPLQSAYASAGGSGAAKAPFARSQCSHPKAGIVGSAATPFAHAPQDAFRWEQPFAQTLAVNVTK